MLLTVCEFCFQKHIETAIELNPNDPTPHHMLGRWCYSVSTIWFQQVVLCAVILMLTWLQKCGNLKKKKSTVK